MPRCKNIAGTINTERLRHTPRLPPSNETPEPKKEPQAMDKADLLAYAAALEAQVAQLREKAAKADAFRRVKQTDAQYYAGLMRLEIHGKSITLRTRPAYKFKLTIDFDEEPSIEHNVFKALSDQAQKNEAYNWIDAHHKDGLLPTTITDEWSAAATMIMIMHCLGVQASKNGYIKPRSLNKRKTLYEYMQELIAQDKLGPKAEQADGIILRVAEGHCYTAEQLKRAAIELKSFMSSLERYCAHECEEETEEIEENEENEENNE